MLILKKYESKNVDFVNVNKKRDFCKMWILKNVDLEKSEFWKMSIFKNDNFKNVNFENANFQKRDF